MTVQKAPIIDRVDRKLAFSFGALTLVLMLLVTSVSSYLFIRLQSREEDRLAGALARIIGESVSKVSFSGTYHARLFVEEIKDKTPEIDAVSVESTDGRIIAHSDPSHNGRPVLGEDLAMLRKSLADRTIVVSERTTTRDTTAKIIVLPYGGGIDTETIGVIRLVVNVEKTRQDQQSGFISMLMIATILSCIAVVVILVLSRYFGSAVKELAVQLQAILDNSPALIYVKDRNGHYQFVNKAWHELFHTTNDNVKGKTDLELFPETIAHQFMTNDHMVMHSDTPLTIEEQVLVEDGLRYYHSTKVTIRDTDGNSYGLCGISTDISERKKTEEAMYLQTVKLAQEVEKRRIAQESLQEQSVLLEHEIEQRRNAQDELEKLNEELEQRVEQRTAELAAKNSELERMNKLFVGRELRMVELKERIAACEKNHHSRTRGTPQ